MSSQDSNEFTTEQRVLRMMKKVLSNIAKDTYTAPGLKHPLSESTINEMRECLSLIVSRETEIAQEQGRENKLRPRFIDEPSDSVVVPFSQPPKYDE